MSVVGGFRVGADNRVHTTFGHNPSTLRLCSFDPNLQNIPRGSKNERDVENWVKECFVSPPGSVFWERDFSAIEAVLVGYFAGSPNYIRFAKLGVHAYLTSHIVGRPADLSWDDRTLRAYFLQLKKEEADTYNNAKRIVHGSNYMMAARRMYELFPESFPDTRSAARLQDLYFDLFPEIRRWHRDLCVRVDGTKRRKGAESESINDPWTLGVCYAQNPFGYVHRFYNVLDWEKINNEWISSFGEDAKRLVAFLPQSTAAAIIKQAAKRLFYEFPWVGETLRLLIHDSIFGEALDGKVDECLEISQSVMEAAIPELPLPIEWGLGEFLSIGTEAKIGTSWGGMH